MQTNQAVQVSALTQGYGKQIVLKDINLTLNHGQILALIGPSGAGKTTLDSTIMGMLRPRTGQVSVLGQAVPNRPLLAKIGIDPELRQQIWYELHCLADQGVAIILTTHVMADAEEADTLLMIRNGTAIAQGTPAQLKADYQTDSIEAVFLAAGRQQDAH